MKCTLIQVLRLCTGRTAHRGSRGIALLFLYHGTGRGRGVSVTPRPLITSRKDPVPIVQKAGWAPGPSGRMWKISLPPGFDPRTVQPVDSRYTDCTTRPTFQSVPYLLLALQPTVALACRTISFHFFLYATNSLHLLTPST